MNQNDINNLRGKTAVVGLAESGCGIASGWSAMEIMANSVHDALDDAGIKLNEVDNAISQLEDFVESSSVIDREVSLELVALYLKNK